MSFAQFATGQGLLIRDLRNDGRIHRCPTMAKPRSDNGAYMLERGRGWVQDWGTGQPVQWWRDEHAKPWTDEDKRAWAGRQRARDVERAQAARRAAIEAQAILAVAELIQPRPAQAWRPGRPAVEARLAHPYLIAKGFAAEQGFVDDGALLVPMFDASNYRLIGLQRIAADGSKKFLHGQRAKGAIHRLGTAQARETWLVEGYATGLSVRAALRALYRESAVIVCFSAGNLEHMAPMGTHVMADNDASRRGQEAAEATGLPWGMPGVVGMDANDLHRAEGLEALKSLIQNCLTAQA